MTNYRAADVAAHIIKFANDQSDPVSNLQLQKMLFFCQCTCLRDFDKALFPDAIVAWQYGPVVKSVYHTYSYRGASPIKRAAKLVNGRVQINDLDDLLATFVDGVVKKWLSKPAWELVRKTHEVGGAWDRIYNADGRPGSGYDHVIPVDLMRQEQL